MTQTPRKKIFLIITKSNFGGAQRYVYDLATSLPKDSFDLSVLFGEGGELEERLRDAGIRTMRIDALQRDVSIFRDISVLFQLIKIFKKERPDIIHLNSTKIGGVGALAGRLCGVPKIIFTAHGWAFNEKRNFLSKIAITLLQWLTVLMTHKTIAVSKKVADQILVFPFIGKNKIQVIYNAVSDIDLMDRDLARHALLAKIPPNLTENTLSNAIWIGTVSELHPNKGLDIAIDAFAEISKKYPQAIFAIIGDGQEKRTLASQIIKLGLTSKILMLGFVPDSKKYLKAFDIFTLTSRTEALPYVILEAGIAELPVIASAVGGIPEIIDSPSKGTLAETGSGAVTSIIKALETMIDDPVRAKELGKNLRQSILENFSPEKMHADTFSLYQ